MINEIHFGQFGFLELIVQEAEETAANIARPFDKVNIIISKRVAKAHVHVDAIIDISNMKRTHDKYVVVQAISQQDIPTSTSNTIVSPGNSIFGIGINNANVLSMQEDDVFVIFLTHGQLPMEELVPQGNHRRVRLTEKTIEKLKPFIKDVLIFGTVKGSSPTKIVDFLKKNEMLFEKLPRRYLNTEAHSFSRCSERDAPFLSHTFKDTFPSPGLDNKCSNIYINMEPNINPFLALANVISQANKECHRPAPEFFYERMEESGLDLGDNIEIKEVKEEKQSCPVVKDTCTNMGLTELLLKKEEARKSLLTGAASQQDHSYSNQKWAHEYLTYSDIQFMRTFQNDLLPISEIETNYKWIKYYRNNADPRKSRIG